MTQLDKDKIRQKIAQINEARLPYVKKDCSPEGLSEKEAETLDSLEREIAGLVKQLTRG